MQPSEAGLSEIESSEGFSSKPYLDTIARPPVWTQGFGETDDIGPNSKPITRAEGRKRLRARFNRDYAWALKPFEKLVGFNQNRYDALASFIWNCGTGAVSTSTKVGRALRARHWARVTQAMMEWVKAGGRVIDGLVNRRKREVALFKKAVKDVREIKLTPTQKINVDMLRTERRSARRHGGWDNIADWHNENAEKAKVWLIVQANVLAKTKVKDTDYRDRKVMFLRDVAHNRNGLGA